MRSSSWRRLAGAAAALVLTAVTLLTMTGAALAAVPTADATSEAIPPNYSAGNAAGFRGFYHYTDGSTLAKLILVIKTTGSTGNVYLSATKNGGAVPGNSCSTATGDAVCTFKTVRTDDRFVVLAAYAPDGSGAVSATYNWSSSGATTSDGGTSHGDIWDGITHTATLSGDSDYGGGFTVASGATISNFQVVSAGNPQATSLGTLGAGLAATVRDGIASAPCTDTLLIDCSRQFGEVSEVTVGDGQAFGSAFTIVITYYSGNPKGFVHGFGTLSDPQQEFVGPCAKRSPVIPCFVWNSKLNAATITTFHNGSWRGLN